MAVAKTLRDVARKSLYRAGSPLTGFCEAWSRSTPPRWLLRMAGIDTRQAGGQRHEEMARFFSRELQGPEKLVLEVGTWFAEGSTPLLFQSLDRTSTVVLVDAWQPFSHPSENSRDFVSRRMSDLTRTALGSTLNVIDGFQDQLNAPVTCLFRGDSRSILPLLPKESFDLVYLDGSHYYQDILSDIAMAKTLVKANGGIVCGDDLEFLPTPELVASAADCRHLDYVQLSSSNGFHPGVLLAVAESFNRVSMQSGFWWAKRGKNFG